MDAPKVLIDAHTCNNNGVNPEAFVEALKQRDEFRDAQIDIDRRDDPTRPDYSRTAAIKQAFADASVDQNQLFAVAAEVFQMQKSRF